MEKKIYCKDCKYFHLGTEWYCSFCDMGKEYIVEHKESWHSPAWKEIWREEANPSKKNKNNDCSDFEQKRQKMSFWH